MTDQAARDRDWAAALAAGRLPPAVERRLADARAGRTPWVATMTPAELLLARSHGIRPIATVSGNCWYAYGRSWTEGHAAGWAAALDRLRAEAVAAGANAVVDVQLRTVNAAQGASMDFTLIGTAVSVAGLAPSRDPVVATVPALEFVRLLEMDIVPTGIAVGARYEWLGAFGQWNGYGSAAQATQWQTGVFAGNQPLTELGRFWEAIRRDAHADLRHHAATMGNGVLAHTQFGQLIRQERDKQPPAYLGRHIVIGTVVDVGLRSHVPHGIALCIDLRDGEGRLGLAPARRGAAVGDLGEEQGGI